MSSFPDGQDEVENSIPFIESEQGQKSSTLDLRYNSLPTLHKKKRLGSV